MSKKEGFKEAHEIIGELMEGKFDRKELGRQVLSQFGGIQGLIRELKLDHDALKPGHKTRLLIKKQAFELLGTLDDEMGDIDGKSYDEIAENVKNLEQQLRQLESLHAELSGKPGSSSGWQRSPSAN